MLMRLRQSSLKLNFLGSLARIRSFSRPSAILDSIERELDSALTFAKHERADSPKYSSEHTQAIAAATTALNKSMSSLDFSIKERLSTERGSVSDIDGFLAYVEEMPSLPQGSVVKFEPSGNLGLVMKITNEHAVVAILGKASSIAIGDSASFVDYTLKFPVGARLTGRVISPAGVARDGGDDILSDASLSLAPSFSAEPPSLLSREHRISAQTRIFSGLVALDTFYPVARGNRVLIVGPENTGKSTIALDLILHQRLHNETFLGQSTFHEARPSGNTNQPTSESPLHCVYVLIGKSKSSIEESVSLLKSHGAMEYTTVIAALDKDPPMMQYLAPYVGTAVAEYYRDRGQHAMIIFDDLSQHSHVYTNISKHLHEIPINQRFMHGPLLERAGILSDAHGGGSLTMICLSRFDNLAQGLAPSVETVLQLDETMSENGMWPAINCTSVSHLPNPRFLKGFSHQLASLIKKYLSDSREISLHAELTREFGLPLEDETRATLEYRKKLNAFFLQQEPLFWEEQALVLYAALRHDFEDINVSLIPRYSAGLLDFVRQQYPNLLHRIASLSSDSPLPRSLRFSLEEIIDEFHASFVNSSSSGDSS